MSRLRGQLADPLLSVVMPVFNEKETIDEIGRWPCRSACS